MRGAGAESPLDFSLLSCSSDPYCDSYMENVISMDRHELIQLPQIPDQQLLKEIQQNVYDIPGRI